MTKRKHRSQAEWQIIIQQQKASGLNVAAFCRQQELSSKTFYKRRRGLRTPPDSEVPTVAFMKITKPARKATVPTDAMGVLHYSNSQLHIMPGCDVQWLAQLLQVLS
jgi:hypothetical protein